MGRGSHARIISPLHVSSPCVCMCVHVHECETPCRAHKTTLSVSLCSPPCVRGYVFVLYNDLHQVSCPASFCDSPLSVSHPILRCWGYYHIKLHTGSGNLNSCPNSFMADFTYWITSPGAVFSLVRTAPFQTARWCVLRVAPVCGNWVFAMRGRHSMLSLQWVPDRTLLAWWAHLPFFSMALN